MRTPPTSGALFEEAGGEVFDQNVQQDVFEPIFTPRIRPDKRPKPDPEQRSGGDPGPNVPYRDWEEYKKDPTAFNEKKRKEEREAAITRANRTEEEVEAEAKARAEYASPDAAKARTEARAEKNRAKWKGASEDSDVEEGQKESGEPEVFTCPKCENAVGSEGELCDSHKDEEDHSGG